MVSFLKMFICTMVVKLLSSCNSSPYIRNWFSSLAFEQGPSDLACQSNRITVQELSLEGVVAGLGKPGQDGDLQVLHQATLLAGQYGSQLYFHAWNQAYSRLLIHGIHIVLLLQKILLLSYLFKVPTRAKLGDRGVVEDTRTRAFLLCPGWILKCPASS